MKSLRNRVNLIGNLGSDPEIKQTEAGNKMAKVSLATSDTYKNSKGEKISETQWHNLVAWGKTAELIEKYTRSGSRLAVEGKLVTRTYNDKSGQKKFYTEVELSEILFLDHSKNNPQ